jgi:hypothetical protein
MRGVPAVEKRNKKSGRCRKNAKNYNISFRKDDVNALVINIIVNSNP